MRLKLSICVKHQCRHQFQMKLNVSGSLQSLKVPILRKKTGNCNHLPIVRMCVPIFANSGFSKVLWD